MLSFLYFWLLLILAYLISFKDSISFKGLQAQSLFFSGIVFIYSLKLLFLFDYQFYYFQYIIRHSLNFEYYNLHLSFGLDGLSLFFFILSSFLIFISIAFVIHESLLWFYVINLFVIELLLLLVFSVLDILLFYVFFEAILIPMYIIIGLWGSRERKIWAVYMLFFYTLCGSLLMLLGVLYIYFITGTFNLEYLLNYNFTILEQKYLWLAFFLSFSSKIPVFPLHIWLPEAHVEAPTIGSVILAGVLLKLGVYGFIRFSLPLFPIASIFYAPLVYCLCSIGVVYTSITAIRQVDLKRIIAYSSVAHMNLIVIGLFSFNLMGLEGAVFQSISHGFVSSALFFLVGMIYVRYHTRSIYYYSGLAQVMPLFATYFLIFTMANIALPGTSSFVGEFLILLGIFKVNFVTASAVILSVVLCGSYSLWVFNKVSFGQLKYLYTNFANDLAKREL